MQIRRDWFNTSVLVLQKRREGDEQHLHEHTDTKKLTRVCPTARLRISTHGHHLCLPEICPVLVEGRPCACHYQPKTFRR